MSDYINPLMNEDETFNSFNFQRDMLIALAFGVSAVNETYAEVFKEYKNDYKVLVRFIYDLNSLCWHFYNIEKHDISQLFSDLYYKADDKYYEMFENNKEAMKYHFDMLD